MPVSETKPSTVARPCSWVSRSTSPSRQPPCACAIRLLGSTHTPRISDMSSISAPSAVASPAMLCPPPFMQSSRSLARANCTPRSRLPRRGSGQPRRAAGRSSRSRQFGIRRSRRRRRGSRAAQPDLQALEQILFELDVAAADRLHLHGHLLPRCRRTYRSGSITEAALPAAGPSAPIGLAGYELMVSADIMRGRYWQGVSKAVPTREHGHPLQRRPPPAAVSVPDPSRPGHHRLARKDLLHPRHEAPRFRIAQVHVRHFGFSNARAITVSTSGPATPSCDTIHPPRASPSTAIGNPRSPGGNVRPSYRTHASA